MNIKEEIITALKITVAAAVACYIADLIGLQFGVSAGIVAILSVLPTKKETVRTAIDRLLAFLAALMIAFCCYGVLGFNLTAFCLYLLVFLIFCRLLGFYSAMAMDSVLISHFLTMGNMDVHSVLNEAGLFLIGTLMGIAVNLTLRKDSKKTEELVQKTDEKIRHILLRASERIMDADLKDYDGTCLVELDDLLDKSYKQALTDYKNDLIDPVDIDLKYIGMRRKQGEILSEIYRNVSEIKTTPDTAATISAFLRKISEQYGRENDVTGLLDETYKMIRRFKELPLPETREEFEDRARLFVLMRSIADFLKIKKEMFNNPI